MLGFRFSYLYKLHTESFLGFNAVNLPGNTPGAFYRSSLPATPVSTPIRDYGRFSEQALRERLCRTPSPRKCRLFEPRASEPELGFNSLDCGLQLSSPDDELDEDGPGVFTPMQPLLHNRFEHLNQENDNAPANRTKRRLFVANISNKVSKKDLQEFLSKFGKVVDCFIVQDHIRKQSRGYGFVIFSNQQDAVKASKATPSELEYAGRVLRIFPAEEKRSAHFRREAREILFQQNVENERVEICDDDYIGQFSQRIRRSDSLRNINEMNDDILLLIFSYLTIQERIRVELVCKKWRSLTIKLWRKQESLELKNMYCLWEFKFLTNSILSSLLKKCTCIKKLDFSTVAHTLDYQAVEIIAQFCPALEHINLSSVKVTNVSLQQLAIKCPKLQYTVLQRCFEVGEKGIWWLLHLCKNLEHLDLTGNPRITGQCFHMAGSNLQTAILNSCSKFSSAGFMKLATRCRRLSSLQLNDCSQLTDRALELLCQSLKNLKVLYAGGIFPELTTSGLHYIGRLTNLEQLSLAHNLIVDDDIVYAISRGCRKLRFLDISGCYTGISDYSLSSLSACYQLRTLHISYLNKITDEGLSSISRQGQLEVIQMRGCPNIGDQGLLTLVLLCPYLQHLDISGCEHATNVTVTACLDSVQARSPNRKLYLVTGGTSIELEALELNDSLLAVSRQNYCVKTFQPSNAGYPSPYAEEVEDDADKNEPEVGAVGGDWSAMNEEEHYFTNTDEVSTAFGSSWLDGNESPF